MVDKKESKTTERSLAERTLVAMTMLSKRGSLNIFAKAGKENVTFNGVSADGKRRLNITILEDDLQAAMLKMLNAYKEQSNA